MKVSKCILYIVYCILYTDPCRNVYCILYIVYCIHVPVEMYTVYTLFYCILYTFSCIQYTIYILGETGGRPGGGGVPCQRVVQEDVCNV